MERARLFQRDLFSNPVPQFTPARTVLAEEVHGLLALHYPHLGRPEAPVLQCGSGDVNSRNFRIATDQGTYLVKRHAEGQGASAVEQAKLAELLQARGVAVPRFEQTVHDKGFIAQYGGAAWSAMEFVPGNYFSGAGDELIQVAGAHAGLLAALATLEGDFSGVGAIRQPGPEAIRQLHQIEARRAQWVSDLGESHAQLLDDCWPDLMQAGNERAPDAATHVHLCHVDLHPHNIVMSEGRVAAIIDLGALLHAHSEAFVAFGLFKLSRQAIALTPQHASHVFAQVDAALAIYRQAGALRDYSPQQMIALVSNEILRRILLILDLNFEKLDRTWNHVLPIQLLALEECKVIFSDRARFAG